MLTIGESTVRSQLPCAKFEGFKFDDTMACIECDTVEKLARGPPLCGCRTYWQAFVGEPPPLSPTTGGRRP
jgi:hypothetical protein